VAVPAPVDAEGLAPCWFWPLNRARPKRVAGHASAAFTLTVYGHVFEADLDSLGERMEAMIKAPDTGRIRDREDSTVHSVAAFRVKHGR
jgi:hypothetical protein